MIFGHKKLSSGLLEDGGDDNNPMDGVGNLADVMLVFACGLMLALITHWNVNLQILDVSTMQEVTQDIEILDNSSSASSSGSGYNELGMVYEDPETGTLYLIAGSN